MNELGWRTLTYHETAFLSACLKVTLRTPAAQMSTSHTKQPGGLGLGLGWQIRWGGGAGGRDERGPGRARCSWSLVALGSWCHGQGWSTYFGVTVVEFCLQFLQLGREAAPMSLRW